MTLEEVRDNLSEDQIHFINQSADFWRYDIGVNVIPADTRNKITDIKWSQYQDEPIPEWQYEKWKSDKKFTKGT
jgi:hypothetical protein